MNAYRDADKGGFVRCTEEDYYEALNVLPPIYFRGGFAMSEPYDGFGKLTRFYCFWKVGNNFWCSLCTLAEARAVRNIPECV